MRGKKQAPKRVIAPDSKYQSVLVAKFINKVMERGKKTVACSILYKAFDIVQAKTKEDPQDVFETALKNVAPQVEVKSRRVGGSNFQVPVEVRGDRKQALAIRWLIEAAKSKKGRPMHQKLAEEFMLAAKNEGDAIKKKQDVHRMAEANRAFAHFA
ncbi:MAG TPA: 30S ribosomal protein S7 [Candidatus Veblenbacteria bacterium]|uniref:Small ribosomal subunit protein uS7 n=3 Tax=Candidatus Vebleniibacteriota TaxID=1817921 RepID=A0A1G2QAI8_9BACT|nr:MAG: 30S ribosomal protein S7 [Parcubacteria group bacterium GW2011_GWD1_42_9]OHA54907.1 MAG: 30S ribosomal protein S7 [Candidatus Veblenbacteria bacterium RIFOXYB1_FULL_43_13]OHA57459.1 MAG: 30S ribosomal protein S7 [Candidatus Veblenbacteria bacterium RIFOXYC2_FULL_42_11]OHA57586.1 MAG: 30S ribosomal protein S7 [Candidatus Veblenbacteria bacterium RIFOXYD1_FULL_43_11]HAO81821.1 30S ribosomal protein S7 [Candidatus Veblenbacteria bacterium]